MLAANMAISCVPFSDVDGKGKINAVDANLIRKFALNMINKFPTEN